MGSELATLAERKLEPMSWHFILVSNSKAADILVFYLSPLLKGTNHRFWLSKHLNQQHPAAQPGAMAAARPKAAAGGKEAGDCELSGSTKAELRGGGWFTQTPGDAHICLPAAKPTESSPATSKPDTASVIKALRLAREKYYWCGLQQVLGHLLCQCALSDNRHTADDDGV